MGKFGDWLFAASVPESTVRADFVGSQRAGRVIAMDCETTGLSWRRGDRVVSLAGIELVDGLPSGMGFSLVFNPGRPSAPAARRVHGLADTYLALQEPFSARAAEVRKFIGADRIVAHNASFDFGFINNEFTLAGASQISAQPICTMSLYRSRFTGSATLDRCCAVYNLNCAGRAQYHGAFVDAALTAALFQGLTDARPPPIKIVTVAPLLPTNSIGRPEDYRSERKRGREAVSN